MKSPKIICYYGESLFNVLPKLKKIGILKMGTSDSGNQEDAITFEILKYQT